MGLQMGQLTPSVSRPMSNMFTKTTLPTTPFWTSTPSSGKWPTLLRRCLQGGVP